ncbi:hypothetical protein K0T92_21200 [Paenibacillus oenotherae]|uniref:Uncharacterized protein n=1 Tax=Paenibacillus oenotherae TaxID=1435645 RepID=A0ABS7DBW8_9BACL|nr:hypothetical protein [Paenibacillus oenotherae]MBW7477238.1 hypothetical protein [Paenibacillus oenotherae]
MRHAKETMLWNRGAGLQAESGAARAAIALALMLSALVWLEGAGVMLSAATYVIVAALAFVAACYLSNRSSSTRMMQISSIYGDEIDEAVRRAINREVIRVTSRRVGDGQIQHTLQLAIYRLEELAVKDLIQSIDPDAVVCVIPINRWRELGEGGSKPRRSGRLPGVSKYGNKLSD